MTDELKAALHSLVKAPSPPVFPAYILLRIKRLLLANPDPDAIIQRVGMMQSVGDCRHTLALTDYYGTTYKITIEVDKERL